jgi:peptide/nickel transport system substrate-binding protein
MTMRRMRGLWALILVAAITSACGTGSVAPGRGNPAGGSDAAGGSARKKSITVAVTGAIPALSIAGDFTPTGGWMALTELHSDGLVTSASDSRQPVGRLAERVPSLDDGSITILPDGRMRTEFHLRPGITWHDGEPFTAQDLVFSHQLMGPGGIPIPQNDAVRIMDAVEAPDATTFVVTYKTPYYLGAALGPFAFWPLPRHILQPIHDRYLETHDPAEVLNAPYWTTAYVHLGAFRLARFDPGEALVFEAYDRYFLGRPKLDVIQVRLFGDINTIVANLLSGSVQLVPSTVLRNETALQLKERWDQSGDGKILVRESSLRTIVPQFRPELQAEPANLDRNVRVALLHALDRVALADGVNGGNPQLVAWSIIPARDQLSKPVTDAIQDTLRQFTYSPDRARALLREAGWTPGTDGIMRHAPDGRPYRTALWSSLGLEREIAAYADYWRQVGIEVDEATVPAARTRDSEYRAQFPGWDTTGADVLDQMARPPATAASNWNGNQSGYDDPQARRLVQAFTASITDADQARTIRAVSDYYVDQLPFIPVYFLAAYLAVRKEVSAFADAAGGYTGQTRYGSFSRNAYVWDLK